MTAETWTITHPSLGRIEVSTGTGDELRALDPDFPRDRKDRQGKQSSASPRLLVRVEGTVVARKKSLSNTKIDLSEKTLDDPGKRPDAGEFGHQEAVLKPFLEIESNWADSWIRTVTVRVRDSVVLLDAPAGSRAAKRQEAMERSAFKRWLYPLLGGIGKGGWALGIIILGPLVVGLLRRLWQWLSEYLPDWEINLPSIPWPDITLPSISLPSIPWPDLTLPNWDAPWWVGFLAEYSKVWVPVLIGVGIGIVAIRNHRRSERTKREWEETQAARTDAARADVVTTLQAPATRATHVFRARIGQLTPPDSG
ncbi:hypothetical protein PQI66_12325 [Corynebacterium sp. USCH3]|uniref:hypothetical protein n=1 Tax=Corynebacterium sp. USCH3 TaxID=3024840 RepID=UPI0030A75253